MGRLPGFELTPNTQEGEKSPSFYPHRFMKGETKPQNDELMRGFVKNDTFYRIFRKNDELKTTYSFGIRYHGPSWEWVADTMAGYLKNTKGLIRNYRDSSPPKDGIDRTFRHNDKPANHEEKYHWDTFVYEKRLNDNKATAELRFRTHVNEIADAISRMEAPTEDN